MREIVLAIVKKVSVGDLVFFMVGSTVCYLAIVGRISSEQFIAVVGTVFGAYYVHKAQNKKNPNDESTTNIIR